MRTCTEKMAAGALLSGKCCCFVQKLSLKSRTSPSEEEEEDEEEEEEEEEWPSGDFLVRYFNFAMLFSATGCVVRHENTRR